MKNWISICTTVSCVLILFTSCKIADIRPLEIKESSYSTEKEKKGKEILEEVVARSGFDKLEAHKVYEFTAKDDWPGFMGKQTMLWPDNNKLMKFKYSFHTFDGSVEFMEGKSKGLVAGLQSWQYYEIENDNLSFNVKVDDKKAFGLTAFHYFTELPYRLLHAPMIQYAGEEERRNKKYDLVFVTWESLTPHSDFDQYLLWINQETDLIDYCVYTLRDNKNPIIRKFYGSIAYLDYRTQDGITLPYQCRVFIDDNVFKKENYFHQWTIEEYSFGQFDEKELYPDIKLGKVGDAKIGKE